MKGIACPHCTFLNPSNKVKCGMCLRLLRKRERPDEEGKTATKAKASSQQEDPSASAHSSPSPPTQRQSDSRSHSPSNNSGGRSPKNKRTTARESGSDASHESSPLSREASNSTQEEAPSTKDAPAPTAVPTFFSTGSGKPVTVRRESLLKAAAKLQEGPSASPLPESRVATFFETASGKKVTVQKESIEKAKATFASLDESGSSGSTTPPPLPSPPAPRGAPPLATVSTLFTTAGGTAVRVAEASLRRAREKMAEAAEDDAAPAPPEGDAEQTREKTAPASSAALPSSIGRLTAPTVGLSAGRRRGFVPPQQRLSTGAPAVGRPPLPPTVTSTTASTATSVPGTSTSAGPPRRSTRLAPLKFASQPCASPAVSPAPSLPAIMSDEFAFTASDCGPTLALLLGVRDEQTVRLSQWHALLLKLGASAQHCTVEWCRHALLSAMARLAAVSDIICDGESVFSAEAVLLCLLQAYNTEMVEGERPALRKMVEGDIPSASLVVLYLSSIREERAAPHMRTVTLSDGIYHMKVTCDVPLSNLLREGVLRPGQKLAVCGARLLLHHQCSPTECDTQAVLAINYNCVRAVSPQVPLGVCHGEPPALPLALVHPLGGLVPAIEGVVARVLPAFFITQEAETVAPAEDGSRPARERAVRAVRSHHAQLQVSDRLLSDGEAASGPAEAKPLSRVTSLLIVKDGVEALVQQWETVDERGLLADDEGGLSLPVEGSWVTLYALNPARSRTAAAPFTHAKLFFSARKMHFAPSKRPLQHLRQLWTSTADKNGRVCVGDAVDVCGLFVGQHKNKDGTFVLVLLEDGLYAVVQIPVPSVSRVLTFPLPAVERVPLLVLNATFLTTEDSVAGSDCCRLFANEYTAVLQRSTQSNFKESLATAAALRAAVEAAPQKYAARKAEIFRCLDEGDAAAAAGDAAVSYAQRRDVVSTAEVPLEANGLDSGATVAGGNYGSGGVVSASAQSREGRLPYYLRQGNSGPAAGTRRLPGVYIPTPGVNGAPATGSLQTSPLRPAVPTAVPQSRAAAPPREGPPSRFYGNISDLMFAYDARLNRRAWHPLEDALPGDDMSPGGARGGDAFQYVQLYWTVSASSDDDVMSKVSDKRALFELLEAVCPLQELCSLIAEERHIDVSLQRSETVAQWRKESRDTTWWRFFADSRLLASAAELEEKSPSQLWWLSAEWAEAMKMVKAKLQTAFFFVALRGGALRHCRLISDSCDVRELPQD